MLGRVFSAVAVLAGETQFPSRGRVQVHPEAIVIKELRQLEDKGPCCRLAHLRMTVCSSSKVVKQARPVSSRVEQRTVVTRRAASRHSRCSYGGGRKLFHLEVSRPHRYTIQRHRTDNRFVAMLVPLELDKSRNRAESSFGASSRKCSSKTHLPLTCPFSNFCKPGYT